MRARLEVQGGARDFASGLLLDLLRALRSVGPGELVALTSTLPEIATGLEAWSRLTGNAIVSTTREGATTRFVVRSGEAAREEERPLGSRLWLYANFDCNLRCDYCCVRSSPSAPRRALGLERVARIAAEAPALGVREIFVTGGEPFILADIDAQILACASAAPTTILTNAMLFQGARRAMLASLPRDRVTLQISLDSGTPELHDLRRGAGSWEKAWRGVAVARAEGFRVRLAATVSSDAQEQALRAFLDAEGVADDDRVIRRVALRGFADEGVALARADLVPEMTITADGVYWHPVGADDEDLLVSRDIFPLARALEAMQAKVAEERAFSDKVASVFFCA
jgi:pyruvate-formate lyase-activating enzyme